MRDQGPANPRGEVRAGSLLLESGRGTWKNTLAGSGSETGEVGEGSEEFSARSRSPRASRSRRQARLSQVTLAQC